MLEYVVNKESSRVIKREEACLRVIKRIEGERVSEREGQ